jgi:hypothetical protein
MAGSRAAQFKAALLRQSRPLRQLLRRRPPARAQVMRCPALYALQHGECSNISRTALCRKALQGQAQQVARRTTAVRPHAHVQAHLPMPARS